MTHKRVHDPDAKSISKGSAHIFYALREPRVNVPEDVADGPLRCRVVCKVEGGRVNEGEGEGVEGVRVGGGQLDVDGRGPDVGGEAGTTLDELCDGGELFLGGGGGNERGVEEEAEEGGLAGASASDHEGVCGAVAGCVGVEPVGGGGGGPWCGGHGEEVAVLTGLVAVVDLLTTRGVFGAVHGGEQRGMNRAGSKPRWVARRERVRVLARALARLWLDKALPLSGVSREI